MRRSAQAVAAALVAVAALTGTLGASCGGSPPPAAPTDDGLPHPTVRLVVLTDLVGTIEPCGCTSRPLGGVDKLAATVARLRHDAPTVFVHAGDLLFDGRVHGGVDGADADAQEVWKAETLADILSGIGLAASTAGRTDVLHGDASLRALSARARFPLLAAGVRCGGQPIGPAEWPIVAAGGLHVGLVGVSAMEAPDGTLPPGITRETAPLEAARAAVRDVRMRGADVVVALVRGDRRLARQVGQGIDGVDFVVVGGLDAQDVSIPSAAGDATVLHAGRQGRGVVVVDLFRKGRGTYTDVSAWTRNVARTRLETQMGELRGQLRFWEHTHASERDISAQRARLERMQHEHDALAARPAAPGNSFAARLVELAPELHGDPRVAAQMDAYDARVNDHNRQVFATLAPKPAEPGQPTYVGVARCQSCHAAAVRWWHGHPHGSAYATLQREHKEFNLSCVGCHVTGYNEPGGSNVTHVEGLTDVQCEQCHGPGSAHAETPTVAMARTDVPEELCRRCHEPEHSDRFDYPVYRQTLIVPGHGRPSR